MENINIKKGIEQIKKVNLTSEEKGKMLSNLSVYADLKPAAVPSGYFYRELFTLFNSHRTMAYALASIIIMVLAGGSAVYASEKSLPGDLFYPVKTNIVEPIKVAMAPSFEAKAKIEGDLAETRLKEAETLTQKGKLTPSINKDIRNNFENHVSNFQYKKELARIVREDNNSTTSKEKDAKIQKDFDNKIQKHSIMLNKIQQDFENGKNQVKNYSKIMKNTRSIQN